MTIEIREGGRKAAFEAPLNAYGAGSPYVRRCSGQGGRTSRRVGLDTSGNRSSNSSCNATSVEFPGRQPSPV